LGWPSVVFGTPVRAIVVAPGVCLALAVHLFDMIKALCPELSIIPTALACFLTPVSEDTGKFSLTVLVECHPVNVALIAEPRELSYGFQKVVIGVEWVRVREALIPLLLSEEFFDSLDIGCVLVHVTDVAVVGLR
jgi:hypothetical protein